MEPLDSRRPPPAPSAAGHFDEVHTAPGRVCRRLGGAFSFALLLRESTAQRTARPPKRARVAVRRCTPQGRGPSLTVTVGFSQAVSPTKVTNELLCQRLPVLSLSPASFPSNALGGWDLAYVVRHLARCVKLAEEAAAVTGHGVPPCRLKYPTNPIRNSASKVLLAARLGLDASLRRRQPPRFRAVRAT